VDSYYRPLERTRWRESAQRPAGLTPAARGQLIGLTGGEQTFGLVIRGDECVDRISGSGDAGWYRWLRYRLKGPESDGPFRKLFLYSFLAGWAYTQLAEAE
jgi:hypothetical protein